MPTTSSPSRPEVAAPARTWWRRAIPVAVTAVVVTPVLVALLSTWGQRWFPVVDSAFIELRLHDLVGHPTEVGPYSRVGASHPGPLMFYLLAPVYWLTGADSLAALRGAAVLNAVAVVVTLWLAHRRGGTPFLLAAATGLSLLLWSSAGELADTWNPWLGLLPFVLFVLASWSVAVGDHPVLPLATFVGWFLVQTHVAYVVLVLPVLAWSVMALGWHHRASRAGLSRGRRIDEDHRLMVSVGFAMLLTVVVWLPPVHQQLVGDPGNLAVLVDEVRDPDQPPVGGRTAVGVLARELGLVDAPWLGGFEDGGGGVATRPAAALLVPALPFAVALGLAVVRRRREAARLQVTVAVTVLAGLLAVSRIDGVVSAYLVRWAWGLALLVWLSIGWSLWSSLPDDWARRVAPAAGALLLTATTVCSLLASVEAARDEPPNTRWSRMIDTLDDPTFAAVDDRGPVELVPASGTTDTLAAITGLQLQAAVRDVEFVAPDGNPDQVGRHRTEDPAAAGTSLVVGSGEDVLAELAARPGLEEVARYDGEGEGQPVAVFRAAG